MTTTNQSQEILHIASFNGNIGDNASHLGTYKLLAEAGWNTDSIQEWEIRKTYQQYQGDDRWHFDQQFIEAVNNHCLTIIGGGNYFETWIEASKTGTTIDIDPNLLAKVTAPLVFNAVGFDPYKGHPQKNLDRFKRFVEAATKNSYIKLSVRNDGSLDHLKSLIGEDYAACFTQIPDPGFFLETPRLNRIEIPDGSPYWAINLACDMADIRFDKNDSDTLTYTEFIIAIGKVLNEALFQRPELRLVFVPHIFSDLTPIAETLTCLDDQFRRNRVSVAPYLSGFKGAKYIFDLYQQAELAMGNRFHANVCSIGFGTPSIGLVTYPKLEDTYDLLKLSERHVNARQPHFERRLETLIKNTLADKVTIKRCYQEIRKELVEEANYFYGSIQRPM